MNAFEKLAEFAWQRPGIDPANYSDRSGYNTERRNVSKQLERFATFYRFVEYDKGRYTDDIMAQAGREAWGGRLNWTGAEWEYTPGQYYCVEYRGAALAVLVRASQLVYEHQLKREE